MKYLSCSEASALMGATIRRIQQMCKNGEIPGAVKQGHSWLIPKSTVWNRWKHPSWWRLITAPTSPAFPPPCVMTMTPT